MDFCPRVLSFLNVGCIAFVVAVTLGSLFTHYWWRRCRNFEILTHDLHVLKTQITPNSLDALAGRLQWILPTTGAYQSF